MILLPDLLKIVDDPVILKSNSLVINYGVENLSKFLSQKRNFALVPLTFLVITQWISAKILRENFKIFIRREFLYFENATFTESHPIIIFCALNSYNTLPATLHIPNLRIIFYIQFAIAWLKHWRWQLIRCYLKIY